MVDPDVGPDEASFQPLILFSGIWILMGGLARLAALARRLSLNAESRLISSSMRVEKRYRNIHLPRFTTVHQMSLIAAIACFTYSSGPL